MEFLAVATELVYRRLRSLKAARFPATDAMQEATAGGRGGRTAKTTEIPVAAAAG